MKKSKVRCWKVKGQKELFISYPESNMGHQLIICTRCGHLYSVDIARMVYIGPKLSDKLKDMACYGCNADLSRTFAYYPETYINENGECSTYERSTILPEASDSIIKEFPEIYS